MQEEEEAGGDPRRPSLPRCRHPRSRSRPLEALPCSSHTHSSGHPAAASSRAGRVKEAYVRARARSRLPRLSVPRRPPRRRRRRLPFPPTSSVAPRGLKLSRRNRGEKGAGDVERVTWTNGSPGVGLRSEWGGSTWTRPPLLRSVRIARCPRAARTSAAGRWGPGVDVAVWSTPCHESHAAGFAAVCGTGRTVVKVNSCDLEES